MLKRWRRRSGIKKKKKPGERSRRIDDLLLESTTEKETTNEAVVDDTVAAHEPRPFCKGLDELEMEQVDSSMENSEIKIEDLADISEEKDSILSIVKSLEEQVDAALEAKEALEAELDATQKKLSEESAARARLEERVKSLEPQAALANQAREAPSFAEGERNKVANLPAEPQPLTKKGKSLSTREEIRSVIIEELGHLQATEGKVTLPELEQRVRFMAETVEALQNKIVELSDRGLPHETLVSAAIDSVEGTEFLRDEERAVLASIFRQNIAVQKPYLIDTAVC